MNKLSSKSPASSDLSNSYVKLLVSDSTKDTEDIFSPVYMRLFSAIFYGISSFLIIVINKILLTSYRFPSTYTLGIGQMIVTLLVLYIGRSFNVINFPSLSRDVIKKLWPLPVFFIGNLICGLGGTKHLSLPMFTVLRRFTILMTLVGEYFILHTKRSLPIILTVFAMVGGAMIAAVDDLTFDAKGYIFVLCNDFFTAANNICVKKKLDAREISWVIYLCCFAFCVKFILYVQISIYECSIFRSFKKKQVFLVISHQYGQPDELRRAKLDLGKYGLLFYNALFMILPLTLLCWYSGEADKTVDFPKWMDMMFLATFLFSCFMGFILMYSTVLCTAYNTALTTTIVGVLKNILVTYVGMYLGGDYIFSWTNFMGLTISMSGSLVYTYITFTQKQPKSEAG